MMFTDAYGEQRSTASGFGRCARSSILVLLLVRAAGAADVRVPADAPSIQDAINRAAAGDRVLISPGRYTENLVLRSNIDVRGLEAARVLLVPASRLSPTASADGITDVVLANITFLDASTAVRVSNSDDITIASNVFVGATDAGVRTGALADADVLHNVFFDNSVGVARALANTHVVNNIFAGNRAAITGENGFGDNNVNVSFNCFFQNGVGDPVFGTSARIGDPLFVDSGKPDFHLRQGSVCIDSGTGTDIVDNSVADAGAYGGGFADAFPYPVPHPEAADGSVAGNFEIDLVWQRNLAYLVTSSVTPGGYRIHYGLNAAVPPFAGTDAGGGAQPSPIEVGDVESFTLANLQPVAPAGAAPQLVSAEPRDKAVVLTWSAVANADVMITRSGVKLLDFGLAKLRQSSIPGVTVVAKAADATAEGTILGTVQYMAPEQLEGGEADARTDIFAFGTLFHEMVTGKPAFAGKTPMSLMGSILRDTPPPASTLERTAPAALDRLIATCLAKDPEDRWQSARDIARELTWIAGSDARTGEVRATRGTISLWRAAAIAVVVSGVAAAAAWSMRSDAPPVESPIARLTVTLPLGHEIGDRTSPPIAVSPDGSTLAYVATVSGSARQLFVRALDTLDSRPLAGTEGAAAPFFSPDGHWLAFIADGKLNKIPLTGGAPQTLSDLATGMGGAWAADDTIYFLPSSTSGVWKVPAAGGTPEPVTTLDRANGEVSHRWPQVLPGGEAIVFTVWTGPGSDERHLHLQMLAGGERRVLLRGASTGRYVGTGHLLYSRDDALTVVPFDIAALQVTGPSVALPERALDDEGAHFGVSDSGTLVYIAADARRFERRLVWVDDRGVVEPVPSPARPYTDPQISPDGRYAAFTNIGPVETIWIHDFSRGTQTALTTPRAGSSQSPTWTADGTHIVYRGTRAGFRNLFWKAVDGSGDEQRLTTSEYLQTPTSASPDRNIVFNEGGRDIWVLPIDTRKPVPFLQTPALENASRFSPDGRWLAYVSSDSGVGEVYVRPFPGPGGRLQISNGGGSEPVWSRSGRELFFRDGNRMMSAALSAAPTLTAERPRLLFEGSYLRSDTGGAGYDVAADGRFLMIQPVEPERASTSINVVIHWFDDLKRRGPAGAN